MNENDNDKGDCIYISRAELNAIVKNAAQEAVRKEAVNIGQALASDLQDALRAIDDEMGRFSDRLKRLEAWIANYDADVHTEEQRKHKEASNEIKGTKKMVQTQPIETSRSNQVERKDESTKTHSRQSDQKKERNAKKLEENLENECAGSGKELNMNTTSANEQVTGMGPTYSDTDGWTRVTKKRREARYGRVERSSSEDRMLVELKLLLWMNFHLTKMCHLSQRPLRSFANHSAKQLIGQRQGRLKLSYTQDLMTP